MQDELFNEIYSVETIELLQQINDKLDITNNLIEQLIQLVLVVSIVFGAYFSYVFISRLFSGRG